MATWKLIFSRHFKFLIFNSNNTFFWCHQTSETAAKIPKWCLYDDDVICQLKITSSSLWFTALTNTHSLELLAPRLVYCAPAGLQQFITTKTQETVCCVLLSSVQNRCVLLLFSCFIDQLVIQWGSDKTVKQQEFKKRFERWKTGLRATSYQVTTRGPIEGLRSNFHQLSKKSLYKKNSFPKPLQFKDKGNTAETVLWSNSVSIPAKQRQDKMGFIRLNLSSVICSLPHITRKEGYKKMK